MKSVVRLAAFSFLFVNFLSAEEIGYFPGFSLSKFESVESALGRTFDSICVNLGEDIYDDGKYEGLANCWAYFVDESGNWFSTEDGRNLSDRKDLLITATVPLGFARSSDPALDAEVRAEKMLEVARGDHDEFYRRVARYFVEGGHQRAVLRLGHEFNGWNYIWLAKSGNHEHYINAWRHVASILKEENPSFLLDYNMDRGGYAGSEDNLGEDMKRLCYPGDEFVDVIGSDIYDSRSWAKVESWLNEGFEFAKSRGKPFSIPEWGLSSNGDNLEFMEGVASWIESKRKEGHEILYANYFDYGAHSLKLFPESREYFYNRYGELLAPDLLEVK